MRPRAALSTVAGNEPLLRAAAQASGGLLLAAEVPGAPVFGEFVARVGTLTVVVR